MNFELFFAKKVLKGSENSFAKPIIRISIVAITLGIAMMTLSLSIVQGFQAEIKKKIVGIGSHIQITKSRFLTAEAGIKTPFFSFYIIFALDM